jgi:hypothetical protein
VELVGDEAKSLVEAEACGVGVFHVQNRPGCTTNLMEIVESFEHRCLAETLATKIRVDGNHIDLAHDLTGPLTLIAVSSSSNQDKGDADPSNWLPSNGDDVCRYIAAWVVIKTNWGLSMDQSEHGRIGNLLEGRCAGTTVADAVPIWPTPPVTTTTTQATTTTVAGLAEVSIATIRYDGPGNDVVYNDSEYVLLRNDGDGTADVGGWSLEDEADHVITIPSGYVIQPGAELRVYTGPGDDTNTKYFEGLGQAIWNNSGGDIATLRNKGGTVIDTYSYNS